MASLIPGYEYDVFISYRQKDNKYDGWVTEFVDNLRKELEATFKEDISIYFDENPSDGLLETHIVDGSLVKKLNCLIFIPIISQTYCDSKSYAWQHEFCAFNRLAKEDRFGRDISLGSGNISSRILPVKIHDLDHEDKALLENEIGGFLRSIDFIYKSAGVNRPLRANEEHPQDNLNKIYYRDQINKVANAVKEVITALKKQSQYPKEDIKQDIERKTSGKKGTLLKIVAGSVMVLALVAAGYFVSTKLLSLGGPAEKSVAVLPFMNLSNDPEQEYFSDGMVDAILDHLFKIGDLKVISRTSSMSFKDSKLPLKEISKKLGVSVILEGTWQKIGNNVRITAQLIDTRTDTHLWSETYNRDLSDIFSIYSDVAQNIARELKATLTLKETDLIQNLNLKVNKDAYNFFLMGKGFDAQYKSLKAIEMYTSALEIDPYFLAAYSERAICHLYLWWIRSGEWQIYEQNAMDDIRKGLEINPSSSEIKLALAYYYYHVNRDYDNALKIIDELKKESPNKADLYSLASFIYRRKGNWTKSLQEAEKGILLDPLNTRNLNELSLTYGLMHQYDNSIDIRKKLLSIDKDSQRSRIRLFYSYIDKYGDLKIALSESGLKDKDIPIALSYYKREFDKSADFISDDTSYVTDQQFQLFTKAFTLARNYYIGGNSTLCRIYADSARIQLEEKIRQDPNDDRYYAQLGKCNAFLGNENEAIKCGQKAVDLKPVNLDAWQGAIKEQDLMEIYLFTGNNELALDKIEYLMSIPSDLSKGDLLIDPLYDPLRNLPRFQKILKTDYKIKYQ